MYGLKSCFLLVTLAVAVLGQAPPAVVTSADFHNKTTPPPPITTPATPAPNSTTLTPPSTPSTPPTTPPPTTSPTPPTTSPTPPTTSPTPPTTSPTPPTTSPTPPTTSPAPPTTTAAPPTPPPPPKSHKYVVVDAATNKTCIIASLALQFNISYPNKEKNVSYAVVDLPSDNSTVVSGKCQNDTQVLILSWEAGNSLVFTFSVNATDKVFYLAALGLTLNTSLLKDANTTLASVQYQETDELFKTPLLLSYKCDKVQNFNLTAATASNWTSLAVLSLSQTQLQAFRDDAGDSFGAAQDCDGFDTPDVVPIAVGCALTLLVLIVLAAYLIGRRRSQNRGYLSM